MGISEETLAVAKKYTNNSISGISGSLAGKNCTIQSITAITGGNRITFQWTADDSTTRTQTMDVMNGTDGTNGEDGKGISSVAVNSSNHLIITYTDGTTTDAGEVEITAAVDSVNGETGDVILTASDVDAYSKTETDTLLANKANSATTLSGYGITDAYTKTETDTLLSAKADSSTTLSGYGITDAYTKTETDSAITTAIGALDVTDSATAGSYVTTVSETDGKISVTKEAADASPTASSAKMVTSGGVYTDTQNIYFANGVLGAKNLLPNTVATQVVNGVTFTVNDDGSITASGTASASAYVHFSKLGDLGLTVGKKYAYSGAVGGSDSTYNVSIEYLASVNDGEATFTYQSSMSSYRYYLRVINGATISTTFYPMIRLASDTDSTYQPYAETNYQLTQNKVDWESNGIIGAKNLLENTASTTTTNGVTFTVNSDKSVTISGTSTATFTFPLGYSPVGQYRLTGCPSGGTASTYALYVSNQYLYETGNGLNVNFTDNRLIQIYISAGQTFSTPITFYPMIRLVTDTDDTYQPYTMTNQQLTERISKLTPCFARLFDSDGWTTPAVYSNRCTIDSGGYKTENGYCYVSIQITLAIDTTADTLTVYELPHAYTDNLAFISVASTSQFRVTIKNPNLQYGGIYVGSGSSTSTTAHIMAIYKYA